MAEFYPFFKHLHMSLAALSLAGFVLRFVWMWRESALLQHRLTKVLPHALDTLLLLAGLALAWLLRLSPLAQPWLGVKLVLLLLYIVLGTLALKRAPRGAARAVCFVFALLVYAQLVGVAIRHHPWGWLG